MGGKFKVTFYDRRMEVLGETRVFSKSPEAALRKALRKVGLHRSDQVAGTGLQKWDQRRRRWTGDF